jgi:hypothetical protein
MRLSLWSHPRSRSTALERYFANRGDVTTHHEVLADYYYIYRRAEPIGHAALDGERGRSYCEAAGSLLAPAAETVLHKDFPYHAIDELLADRRWLGGAHLVLVRDPRETLYSHLKLRGTITAKNFGYRDLLRWHRHLTTAGARVLVIDSGQLNDDPARVVESICSFAGLPFDAAHLRWDAGSSQEWGKWAGWHAGVAQSNGFGQPSAMPPGWRVPPELAAVLSEAIAAHAELTAPMLPRHRPADTTRTAGRPH